MNVFITGISSGIGYALCNHYLSLGYKVIGMGRRNTISHSNLTFIPVDLSRPTNFSFLDNYLTTDSYLVFNNAGTIGNIQRIGEQTDSDIEYTMQLNAITPMELMQYFLKKVPIDIPLTIVNISSGAGKRPIPSWASYCASKAALDLFSQTVYLEEIERGRKSLKIYSVAPGVVDTNMQQTIRSKEEDEFSSAQKFKTLHQNGELYSTDLVVKKLTYLLLQKYNHQIIYSLREFEV